MNQKKFNEADNNAVFTTKFVIEDRKDITKVYHEADDGAWQFFSDDSFDDYTKVVMVVGLGEMVRHDNTILDIADIPLGYVAQRKFKGDKWIVEKEK